MPPSLDNANAMNKDRSALLSGKLDDIQAEMQRIGYWKGDERRIDASSPQEAFMADKLAFAEWLEYVFLPSARKAIQENALPTQSMVGTRAMREYNYMDRVEEALPLVGLLSDFDALVNAPQ